MIQRSPLDAAANEEVAALIERLRETEQRLEELTAGEVDAVMASDGQAFVLRRAQEQLRRSEAGRHHAILNALPAHIALLDAKGTIVSVNERWERFTRGDAVEAPGHGLGLNYLEICEQARGDNATGAHRAAEGIRAVLNDGAKTFSIEYACQLPTEQRRFVLTVTPLSASEPSGAVVMHTDVTAERQTEAHMRASVSRFRQMAENIRDVFFLVDTNDNRMLYVSPAYETIWGRTCESLYADPDSWAHSIHPDDQAATQENYKKGMQAGEFELEYRIVRPDSSIRSIDVRGFPIRDPSGRIVRITGVAEDITERKQARQELRESERRFRGILDNVKLVSVMLDREARVTYCNEYFLHVVGWSHDEVIGRDWFELCMPPELGDMRPVFISLLEDLPDSWHRDNEIFTRSGERRLIRWNNSVLRSIDGDVIGTASIGEDITEQKRSELKIDRLNRVYSVLSQISALIVREGDRDELFKETCRIAVEAGAYRMAWIGVIDPATLDGKVVAWHGGERGFVDIVKLTAREGTPDSDRPACRAVRLSVPVLINDIASDPSVAPIRDELLHRGHKSAGCFPLMVRGRSHGVLCLFAGEPDVFDDEETRLLLELAGNISFALDHIGSEEQLNYLAYYDALTGLANRGLFLERVAQHVRAALTGGHQLAVFLIDLERFKSVNDSLGQPAGDALLRQVAQWLTANVGDATLFARIGADHFAAVLPNIRKDGDVARALENAMKAFGDHPFHLDDAVFRLAVKVGVAVFPDDGASADTLVKNAEAALKAAKASGERYLFYTQTMTDTVTGKFTLENQLRRALDNGEFVLHYQPKVNLATGKLTGAEALIRWNDPRTGLVLPGAFIPLLEETGMIAEVGRWALREAIGDYLRWRGAGLAAVPIAVNVSPRQLRHRDFIADIEAAIGIDARAPDGLELEITEGLIMEDVKRSIASLQAIRAMRVGIAIDDFGTGFSSLSYLSKLPIDTLKIDRSFVLDMTSGAEGLALVSAIVGLAKSLKLKVVAEGVDTGDQASLLRLLGCDEMQGYLVSEPLPSDAFEPRYLKRA